MASSVQILCPNGRRQNIKITPNTKVLQVLEEVCQKQGFQPSEDYELKHGLKTILDVTLSFRYANLPNNAKLELVKAKKSRTDSPVTIALQFESGNRFQAEFQPTVTLWDILLYWKEKESEKCENITSVINGASHPICIYMREEVIGEYALKSTTLKKLGLCGGKSIIRFLHRTVEDTQLDEVKKNIDKEIAKKEKLLSNASAKPPSNQIETPCDKTVNTDPSTSSDISMEISSSSTSAKHNDEPMDVDADSGAVSNKPMASNSEKNKEISLDSIPGLQIIRPGEPVDLSQLTEADRQTVQNISQAFKRQREEERRRSRNQSHNMQPVVQPAPFKFPEATKGMNLYKNELSQSNPEDFKPCDREKVIFKANDETKQKVETDVSDSFFEVTREDVSMMMKDLQKKRHDMEDQGLMTKAMREQLHENRCSKYNRAIIRVQFPDQYILQGVFRPRETVHVIEKFVRENLYDKKMKFYLYTSPPRKVLADSSQTLIQANLVPASIVYFGCQDNEPPYLSSDNLTSVGKQSDAENVLDRIMPTEETSVTLKSGKSTAMPSGSEPKSSVQPRRPASNTSSSESSDKKVPKWFKVGKK